MRYGELYFLEGVKKQWDLSAKDTQDICDRMVKALAKHHALPMKMSLFPFIGGFSSFSKLSSKDQVYIKEYSPLKSQVQAQPCVVQKLEKIHLCLMGAPCRGGATGGSVYWGHVGYQYWGAPGEDIFTPLPALCVKKGNPRKLFDETSQDCEV